MLIDLLLIAIVVASFGYAGFLAVKRFPHAARINVGAIPEQRQAVIKRTILEEKLKRDLAQRWTALRNFIGINRKRPMLNFFSRVYQKLKDLEHEYRLLLKKDLSSHVTQVRSLEDLLSAAREQIADENYGKAEQTLIEALKLDEHSVKVYTLLSQLYRARGEYDHAKDTLEYILRLTNNKDANVFRSLGDLARMRGDLHTAQEEYLKSISIDPGNHNYYLELAEVYRILEQHAKAQEAAQNALQLVPNNPKILDFLVENSILLHDKKRAQEYLAKLVEVNPQNGKIASFRDRVNALESPTTGA